MRLRQAVGFVGLGVALVILALGGRVDSGEVVQGQPPCTGTVQPGESIQKAIDAAAPGAIICLGKGTWEENVKISKGLTLRGAGRGQTGIRGEGEGLPVITIESDAEIEVGIESLTVAEARDECRDWPRICHVGLLLGGKAKATIQDSQISENLAGIWMEDSAQATIANSQISENLAGIWMEDSAQATIQDSQISENGAGIWMEDSAQATIANSQISENGAGIWMEDSAQATIANSQISENGAGIWMWYSAQATIANSQISENGAGIVMWGSAQATIANSQVSENKWHGIVMEGSAQATIRDSTIKGNGTHKECKWEDFLCNGIEVYDKSRVTIINSLISANTDWGVAAYLKQCGYDNDRFIGTVVFQDMTLKQISGNSTSNNQQGMGNPGDHPWNRPDVPDGQVCLP